MDNDNFILDDVDHEVSKMPQVKLVAKFSWKYRLYVISVILSLFSIFAPPIMLCFMSIGRFQRMYQVEFFTVMGVASYLSQIVLYYMTTHQYLKHRKFSEWRGDIRSNRFWLGIMLFLIIVISISFYMLLNSREFSRMITQKYAIPAGMIFIVIIIIWAIFVIGHIILGFISLRDLKNKLFKRTII